MLITYVNDTFDRVLKLSLPVFTGFNNNLFLEIAKFLVNLFIKKKQVSYYLFQKKQNVSHNWRKRKFFSVFCIAIITAVSTFLMQKSESRVYSQPPYQGRFSVNLPLRKKLICRSKILENELEILLILFSYLHLLTFLWSLLQFSESDE